MTREQYESLSEIADQWTDIIMAIAIARSNLCSIWKVILIPWCMNRLKVKHGNIHIAEAFGIIEEDEEKPKKRRTPIGFSL